MVLKVEGGVLPGFGVQGEKTDFRESWRRLLPNKNYSYELFYLITEKHKSKVTAKTLY